MVHSQSTLSLRAYQLQILDLHFPWYGLWMIFMVMALGPCANWPSVSQDSQVKLCNNKIFEWNLRAISHTRIKARDHYTSSTLIGGKVEPVQVRLALHLRDQQSMRMQDGCKVHTGSYMASNGSCFMVTRIIFHKPPLGCRPNTRLGDHGTPNAQNCRFILILSYVRTRMNRKSLK